MCFWIGVSGGSPHYYSSNAGVAADSITLIAPEAGEYKFWVYGFEATTYNFVMAREGSGSGTLLLGWNEGTRVRDESKSLPEAPPSVIEAPTYVPATPTYKMRLFPLFMNWRP